MRYSLTIAALLMISATMSAADLESITLADGRTLLGVYDDVAGTITLHGAGSAVIRVTERQVKGREPAFVGEAAPRPVDAKRGAATSPVDPRAALAAIDKRAREEKLAVLRRWVLSIDTTLPVVPELGDDPRESDRDSRARAQAVHALILKLDYAKKAAAEDPDSDATAGDLFALINSDPSLVEWYCQHTAAR